MQSWFLINLLQYTALVLATHDSTFTPLFTRRFTTNPVTPMSDQEGISPYSIKLIQYQADKL